MNSRLDWLVLSDYYSIYVTNAPPIKTDADTCYPRPFLLAEVEGFALDFFKADELKLPML